MDDRLGDCRLVLYNSWINQFPLKAILKANVLKKYDICQCIKLENGNSADVYNLNMIIALSYQIDTGHSTSFRKWLISKVASKQKGISLFIPISAANIYNC